MSLIESLIMLHILGGCFHPVRTYNRHTRAFMYVPCGKCDACINSKATKQSSRVREEIKQHLYSVFFTLTYNNASLPRMEVIQDKNGVIQFRPIGRVEYSFDSCPLNRKLPDGNYLFDDDVFLPAIEGDFPYSSYQFGVVCKKDIQDFLKRLRLKIDKLNINENEKKIRYYISSEYGPRTFRPHYHGVLFFDSEELCKQIESLIVNSWGVFQRVQGRGVNVFVFEPYADLSLTSSYIKLCDPNTAYYVAEYVSGNLGLPVALRQRCTSPFHLQSKNPVIGCYKADKEEVLECLSRGLYAPYKAVVEQGTGEVQVKRVPLSSDVLFSLFSKCYGFSDLSYDSKFAVYSFYTRHLEQWKDYIREKLIIYAYERNENCSSVALCEYLDKYPCDRYRSWCERCYPFEYEQLLMGKDENWYSSKKAYSVCQRFDLQKFYPYLDRIDCYLRLFDSYLYHRWHYQQIKFYEFFNELVLKVGFQSAMLHCYPFMLENVHNFDFNYRKDGVQDLNANFRVFLQEFDTFTECHRFGRLNVRKVMEFSFERTSYYNSYVSEQKQFLNKRNKSKKVNNSFLGGFRRIS